MTKGKIMQANRYSLKKRISFTYISVYVGICVLIILSFVVGCALYVRDKCEEPSDLLATEIAFEMTTSGGQIMREFLYEKCLLYGINEVFVYDDDNEVLFATTYIRDNDRYFAAKDKGMLTGFLPNFAEISEGVYITDHKKTVVDDEAQHDVRIIIHHSISDELGKRSFHI